MTHEEARRARGYDYPDRSRAFTDTVYGHDAKPEKEMRADLDRAIHAFDPAPAAYRVFFGDIHGHSTLSDGNYSIDECYKNARDIAKLDFCAVTDHDHGGVGNKELWMPDPNWGGRSRWEILQEKAAQYSEPGAFTAMLGYERDSYPWCNNMVLYYRGAKGEMVRDEHDGEITQAAYEALLQRKDMIAVPHTSGRIDSGCDFSAKSAMQIPRLLEIYSRSGAYEYFDNPYPSDTNCRGGYYQDALAQGALMGCIANSDDHDGLQGRDEAQSGNAFRRHSGITAVWARDNTREAIFEALYARRCYGFMGGRITLDFRINGRYMGEVIPDAGRRDIFYQVTADAPVERVTLVKNERDDMFFVEACQKMCFDYRRERPRDCYYLRVKLKDGRMAWSSPIWVQDR